MTMFKVQNAPWQILLRVALFAPVVLSAPSLARSSLPWLQEQTLNMHRIIGRFTNNDYGFSAKAPPEVAAYVTNGGDANHGLRLILGEFRSIDIYPEYTGFVPGDDKPCRRDQFPWETTSRRSAGTGLLEGHLACVVTFTDGDHVWRVMQTTGSDRGTEIMYTLLLATTRRWLSADNKSFDSVVESFKRVLINP